MHDPTATAVALGLQQNLGEGENNILIFDIGGGTFDVSVLTVEEGIFEVKSTSGDTHFGGRDFDSRILRYEMAEFKCVHGKEITGSYHKAIHRLRIASEQVKIALSSTEQTDVAVGALLDGIDFAGSLTRARF